MQTLTPEEFEAWRAHPVTETVCQYLRDLAAAGRRDWSNGENWTEESRIQVQAFEDLADLDLESIETFYKALEENEHG